jgi:hypothetical protein
VSAANLWARLTDTRSLNPSSYIVPTSCCCLFDPRYRVRGTRFRSQPRIASYSDWSLPWFSLVSPDKLWGSNSN